MPWLNEEQGSEAWLQARRGVITGSNFRVARERLKNGKPSKASLDYARDVARERLGGEAPGKHQNKAMRTGSEQEPYARTMYEGKTGHMVDEVGFFVSPCGRFGVSPDGLVDDDGVTEFKTMVSSDTLFTAAVEGDVSEYMDQCLGYLWLLGRQWVDLALWCPDFKRIVIHRVVRDEAAIQALEKDMLAFAAMVGEYEDELRQTLAKLDQLQTA